MSDPTILIATRGSALALAQSNMIRAQCAGAFPHLKFELIIIKTTGDKLQTASLAQESKTLPKGLFTKELEVALLEKRADLAVHSLKDLPTELPPGLILGAVGKREDVRDVLIYRDANASGRKGYRSGMRIRDFPDGAAIATSSTRRKALLKVANPGLNTPDIRGNVLTRIQKLVDNEELDGTILALAGLSRLDYRVTDEGRLVGGNVPPGVLASVVDTREMLPCVGQGAIGIETRGEDPRIQEICAALNHYETHQAVLAERAFLAGMGGGCQSPVAAYAEPIGQELRMRAVSFVDGPVKEAQGGAPMAEAVSLGQKLANQLKG